ncbi:MAG: Holliday junction resolvase RuvX [Clostridiales bacterium]|nr:Holliday junction resolvase RuvX [Clostridiales bacterium]
MKVLAIDYGDARTGIAISDYTGLLVGTTDVIHSRKPDVTAREIARLAREQGAQRLVMGFPRNMDGTEGPRAALYRDFAAQVEAETGMPVVLWDERRTTVEAHQILSDCNYHGKKRKNTVDAVAASLILEGYLSYLRLQKE